MKSVVISGITVIVMGLGFGPMARSQGSNPVPVSAAAYREVLDRYCVTCHNPAQAQADLDLSDGRNRLANVGDHAEVWERVVQKLRSGAMPPPGMPRPDPTTYDSLSGYLEMALDSAANARPDPGRPVLHRLNRGEYNNAVRDLLDLEIDSGSLLPPDAASGHGFDNIADTLTLSPLLMERYLSAAKRVSRLAIGDVRAPPVTETYVVSRNLEQKGRVSEELPFGSRGGTALRHYFPLDADYIVRIRLPGDGTAANVGLDGDTKPGNELELRLDGRRMMLFSVGNGRGPDEDLEVRIPARAGMRSVGVSFLKDTSKHEGPGRASPEGRVDWVSIEGPYDASGPGDTPSRNKIFVCHPSGDEDERICAIQILSTLARRAFRRPVSEDDIQRLLGLYDIGRNVEGFEAGVGMALQGILISPEFLFRFERDPEGAVGETAYPISDLELASRLSFFLWSSLPDEELLELAQAGTLSDPALLPQQVRRMLDDPRSQALVNNFALQWLHVRNLDSMSPPDPTVFPEFTENLRDAFKTEVDLFFQDIMRNDRSILDLLDANDTFLNEPLARHYGVPGLYGNHFRRVRLADENRWGLLGKGAILTVTSYATRTSPTLRGKWVMENLLGAPPPPPPPQIPPLEESIEAGKLSMRDRMAMHRTNPACASCHNLMDPPGFALENFDGIGRWRTMSGDRSPLDTSGELPDGARFEGPAGLSQVLLGRREQFARTFTEKLLTYALGRGIEYYDGPALRRITRQAAGSDYRWSSVVLAVVESVPFQMRRSQAP